MPIRPYRTHARIRIDGNDFFISAVARRLDQIDAVPEGHALLEEFRTSRHMVIIQPVITGGNACSGASWNVCPLLVQAIVKNNADQFKNDLAASLGEAKRQGITLEHLARQLAVGLSPATYVASANMRIPESTLVPPAGATGQQVMQQQALRIMNVMGQLEDFAAGRLHLAHLGPVWKHELSRLLRPYMAPGRGDTSTIKFDPADARSCAIDPAMKNRPPALGLAHELIHALHNVRGTNMSRVKNENGQNPEEVITTGLPPYNFEKYSDNKLRALWSTPQPLRMKY